MPNHVINEIIIRGATLEDVLPLVRGKESPIDFEVLVPLPLNYWSGSVSIQHEENFPGTHLDAARKTWGTKWNAYGLESERYNAIRKVGDNVILTFQTAWDTPRGWTVALFNTLEKDMTVNWLSEGGRAGHTEKYIAHDEKLFSGPRWTKEEIEEGSKLHRHLHKLLWGVEEFEDE